MILLGCGEVNKFVKLITHHKNIMKEKGETMEDEKGRVKFCTRSPTREHTI